MSSPEWTPVTFEHHDHVTGPFYHGTKSGLTEGDELVPALADSEERGTSTSLNWNVPCEWKAVVLADLKARARRLKSETYALYLVVRDPRTPWFAKLLAGGVVAYALSPIDLIPDFIPVLGYLDDLLLLPLGIWLAIRLVPDEVMRDCRQRAEESMGATGPISRAAAVVVVIVWIALAVLVVRWALGA